MKIFIAIFCFLIICILPLSAQFPPDSIKNWKVSVNEGQSFAEFSGVIDFAKDSSIALFTQAIDISAFNATNPVYAYYNASGADTRIFALFQGSNDPGLYDSTFFAETDSANFVELLTDEDLSAIVNYQKTCLNDTINAVTGCFNKSFGLKWIRLKFNGTNQNSTAATGRWSFILPKRLNAKSSGAFNIKDTR